MSHRLLLKPGKILPGGCDYRSTAWAGSPLLLIGWILWVDVGLSPEAHRLAGILLLTLVWWLTEPIPIPATGLLAVALCVVLHDAGR